MKTFLLILQIIISSFLILIILLQAKGAGISSVFGGQSSFYRSKRGIEKLFVILTVVLGAVFLILSIIQVLI